MNRADLRAALAHPNVLAFLRVIRESESRQTDDAYCLENDGTADGRVLPGPHVDHPSKGLKSPPGRAFGAYQFLASTWAGLVKQYGFPDMSPGCQNEAAVALIAGRGALDEVIAGDLDGAFHLLEKEWTSLPGGAEENAATRHARETFLRWGGTLAGESGTKPAAGETKATESGTPADPDAWQRDERYGEAVTESTINPIPSADEQEARMAPLIPVAIAAIQAFGPQLLSLIPQFGSILGSGSDVQVRNVKLATAAVDAVVKSTGSPNLQAAIETMQRDPEAVKAAQIAAAEVLALVEVGGGIVEARKLVNHDGPWWHQFASLPFAVILLLMPMIYFVIFHVITGPGWTQEIRASVVSAVISGVLFAIVGFALGTSYGSQRKTNLLANQEK